MSVLHKNFEEYNLGREKRFRGDISSATLYIVHDLDAKELEQTIYRLKELTEFKSIETIHSSKLDEILSKLEQKNSAVFLTMHLSLDSEIANHQKISGKLLTQGVFQLNPYNKIAKIFDDKYLFYALLTANAIKQPYTELIAQNHAITEKSLNDMQHRLSKEAKHFIIKPRNGTEKIDFMEFDSLNAAEVRQQITKIHKYDDCIIQERININKEFKVLFLQGKLHISKTQSEKASDPALLTELYEVIDLIDDYAKQNQIIMPEIFSLDVLETMDKGYIILEANIRPAALYRH
jgi:glutathione synthase/RimK-type ligase-like ATP-grasp enzyme